MGSGVIPKTPTLFMPMAAIEIDEPGTDNLQGAIDYLTKNSEAMIMDLGGSCASLVMGVSFQLFKKTKDSNNEKIDPLGEKLVLVFPFAGTDIEPVVEDSDKRIGEHAVLAVGSILKGLRDGKAILAKNQIEQEDEKDVA